jgi:hypothetical protein
VLKQVIFFQLFADSPERHFNFAWRPIRFAHQQQFGSFRPAKRDLRWVGIPIGYKLSLFVSADLIEPRRNRNGDKWLQVGRCR